MESQGRDIVDPELIEPNQFDSAGFQSHSKSLQFSLMDGKKNIRQKFLCFRLTIPGREMRQSTIRNEWKTRYILTVINPNKFKLVTSVCPSDSKNIKMNNENNKGKKTISNNSHYFQNKIYA